MISARNKIKCKVLEVNEGAVNAIVKLEAVNGMKITACITKESTKDLGLSAGKECYAVVKASEVMVANEKVKMSARNQFEGTISTIDTGICNSVIKIDASNDVKFTAVITKESATDLGLKVGEKAVAIIKSSSVMVSVD